MSIYTTKAFWVAAGERAVKTAAQTAAATIGTDALVSASDLDYLALGSVSAGAALLSVLTSLASASTGTEGPSLAGESLYEARHGS